MSETIVTKRCSKCKITKSISEFYKNSSQKDGYCYWCKDCTKQCLLVYAASEKGKEVHRKARRKYKQTEKGQKCEERYQQSIKGKEARNRRQFRYRKTPKARLYRLLYEQSEKAKKKRKQYRHSEIRKISALRFRNSPKCRQWKEQYRDSGRQSNYKKQHYKEHCEEYKIRAKHYSQRNPAKIKAHRITRDAIRKNLLPVVRTLHCFHCGRKAQAYHHLYNYEPEHWFDIIPLCGVCHYRIHHTDGRLVKSPIMLQ